MSFSHQLLYHVCAILLLTECHGNEISIGKYIQVYVLRFGLNEFDIISNHETVHILKTYQVESWSVCNLKLLFVEKKISIYCENVGNTTLHYYR